MRKRIRRKKNKRPFLYQYSYPIIAAVICILVILIWHYLRSTKPTKIVLDNDEPPPKVEFHFYSSLPNMKIKVPTPIKKQDPTLTISNAKELEYDVSQQNKFGTKKK